MESTKITLGTYLPAQAQDATGQRDRKLKKACKDFESMLTYQLLRSMRKTVEKGGLLDGGRGEEIYQSLFDMEIAKNASDFGPNSLARLLYEQLKGTGGAGADAAASKETLSWPVKGNVSSGFGWRNDPITGKKQFHEGLDIAAPKGTPIRAVLPGKVSFSGIKQGYGNIIIVNHGQGLSTLYGHASRLLAPVGAPVQAGAVIGEVGSTGRSTGPHLHFEITQNGIARDPMTLLAGRSGETKLAMKNE